MFTGIVQEIGELESARPKGERLVLVVRAPHSARELRPGDSVAMDGICLTAISSPRGGRIEADATGATLEKTTVGRWRPGKRLNLERALTLGSGLDGHVVQGHVCCVGEIRSKEWRGSSASLRLAIPLSEARGIAPEGSIAIDGVSLTVASAIRSGDWLTVAVSLVPFTLGRTTLGGLVPGSPVNVETDVLLRGASFAAMTASRNGSGHAGLTEAALGKWGYL
jgi:riboflavin synthase